MQMQSVFLGRIVFTKTGKSCQKTDPLYDLISETYARLPVSYLT